MTDKMKGFRLFLFWVFGPCARLRLNPKEAKSRGGKISQGDFNWMKSLTEMTEWSEGDTEKLECLFKDCFPNAYRAYLVYSCTGNHEPWSLASVALYWHKYHCHNDNHHRDVWVGSVCRFADGAVIVVVDGKQLPMENFYNFPLKAGDKVYIHNHVIVEVFDRFAI